MAEQKYEYICTECGNSEWHQKWYMKQKKYPELCARCARNKRKETILNHRKENPNNWTEQKLKTSKRMKKVHALKTSQERTDEAKYRKSCTTAEGRKKGRLKQHNTIKADPEQYEAYCKKRSKIAQEFHDNETDEQKEQRYRKIFKNNGRSKECDDFLQTLNNHQIICDAEQYIHGFIVDGVIQNTKIIIEYYGDMFHCNPRKFTRPDQMCSWLGGRTVQEQWDRDRKRLAALYHHGYRVIIVWGSDWKSTPNDIIGRIQDEMHKN